jgi:acyl-CoA synthetase (AMP-forming)/AMP-acid ligase II
VCGAAALLLHRRPQEGPHYPRRIIRGGYNVYPREVEEALHEHPAQRGLSFSCGQLRDQLADDDADMSVSQRGQYQQSNSVRKRSGWPRFLQARQRVSASSEN